MAPAWDVASVGVHRSWSHGGESVARAGAGERSPVIAG